MADADQTFIVQLMADASNLIAGSKKVETLVNDIKARLKELSTSSDQSFKNLGKSMVNSFKEVGAVAPTEILRKYGIATTTAAQDQRFLVSQISRSVTELEREERQLAKTEAALKRQAQHAKTLGQTIMTGLAVALGINLYNAIRMVISGIQELVNEGMELLKSFYQLEVGVRVLRRSGMNIVTQDVLDNIDKLREKFGIFTTKELVQGAAAFANLIRDLGFTKDQFFELQNAAATLAVVNGRAMDDVQRTIALALSSGYTEGLQRLGVSINRVTIALEAERLGWGRNYMSLTEVQRAIATYNLLIGKTLKYQDDLAKYTLTAAGAFDKLKTSVTNFIQIKLGTNLAMFVGGITLLINAIVALDKAVTEASPAWYKNLRDNLAMIPTSIEQLGILGRELQGIAEIITILSDNTLSWAEKWGKVGEAARRTTNDIFKLLKGGNLLEMFAPEEVAVAGGAAVGGENAEELAQKQADALKKLYQDARDLEISHQRDERDAWIDYQNDLDKIERDTFQKQMDAYDESLEKRAQIRKDADDNILKLNEKLNLDILQENRKFAIDLEESEAKHRENELRAEIEFQEQMQKLREGFLLDLEDALHERDARQILRLIRQYNLEKAQNTRVYNENRAEMDRQRSLEIQELINRRNERIQVLQEEAALRLAQIERETVAAIDAERLANLAKMDEIRKDADREKIERGIRYKQQLDALELHLIDRYNDLALAFMDEFNLTDAELKKQAELYFNTYGRNGKIQQAFDYAIAYARKATEVLAGALNNLWGVSVSTMGAMQQVNMATSTTPSTLNPMQQVNWWPSPSGGKRQEGGLDYVTKPTWFLAGENKTPEWHQWIPANKLGRGSMSPFGGKVDIALLLSPDLEARIISNTLGRTANVILELQRSR